MSAYRLTPMTDHETGAEIRGLDLSQPVSEDVKRAINADFARYHVLVFRDQKLSAPQFAVAAEVFGPLMPQHHKDMHVSGHPEVSEIRNTEIAPGKWRINGGSFHTDHSNHPCPPKATALHTIKLPSYGGDTQFMNVHNAYDALPESMKRRLEGLKAVHVWESKFSPRKMRALTEESRKALPPPALHPIVRVHPQNGRKFIYLNPVRIEGIVGMSDDDAMALVAELMAHATQQQFEYRHKWVLGDMVVWDNRSVMHQANGDYDMKETRHLYRIMVQDDPAHWVAEGEKTLAAAAA